MTVELQVLCEGPTENNFITSVLRPHLQEFAVYPRAIPLRKGNYGIIPFEKLKKAVQNELGKKKPHQFVTTMIDLYGLQKFPGYRRVQDIEAAMASKFNSCQVIPYIQIHEFEAFVFVDLDLLKSQFPDGGATKAAAVLRAEMGDFRPEQIDDGPQTAPSKRLLRVLPGYNKVTNGPAIAKAIGLERLRKACPHFGDWLDRLETLAGAKV